MSVARNIRRKKAKENAKHSAKLANLLADFYEFLSSTPQPSDESVRTMFMDSNKEWQNYCYTNKLMNVDHLFSYNVQEAWYRHEQKALNNE